MAFRSNSGKQIRLIALTGLFMAVIYVLTAYLHIPTTKGYIHIGDGIIFLAASILPAPYAVAAASIGGALSDALSGYWIWVPATLMIKGLTALFFTSKRAKILCARNYAALLPALILCVAGYGFYSGLVIYGSLAMGFADAAANFVQTAASSVLFIAAGAAFDRAGIKKRIPDLSASYVNN